MQKQPVFVCARLHYSKVSDLIQNMIVNDHKQCYRSDMIIKTAKEIGLLVREQRKSRGWTQDIFAQKLGVSRLWVVQMEQGKSTAQIGLVLRALNELGLPMQIDLNPKDETKSPGFIDLDSIIRETATPYTVKG